MGRVEVVFDDELEHRLRLKALNDFGGRKGALRDAVVRAVSEYVNKDPVKNIIKTARDPKATKATRDCAMDALEHAGDAGLDALSEMEADSALDDWTREAAAAYARNALYVREQERYVARTRQPSVVREEYGPERARTLVEREYRRPRQAKSEPAP